MVRSVALEFPKPRVGLNGVCLITPNVLLVAGATDLTWRVDLTDAGEVTSARIWLRHDTMRNRPGEKKPEQPGVNGLRYDARAERLYHTSTSEQLFMGVNVDPQSFAGADQPQFIAGGREWDDFIIEEVASVAFATTHREKTIDRVVLAPDGNRRGRVAIAGDPFNELPVGPSSGARRRGDGNTGRAAYFTTDGGTAAPPNGIYRTAKLLLVEFGA